MFVWMVVLGKYSLYAASHIQCMAVQLVSNTRLHSQEKKRDSTLLHTGKSRTGIGASGSWIGQQRVTTTTTIDHVRPLCGCHWSDRSMGQGMHQCIHNYEGTALPTACLHTISCIACCFNGHFMQWHARVLVSSI